MCQLIETIRSKSRGILDYLVDHHIVNSVPSIFVQFRVVLGPDCRSVRRPTVSLRR